MKLLTIATLTSLAFLAAGCSTTPHTEAGIEVTEEETVLLSDMFVTDPTVGTLHAFAVPSRRLAVGFEQVTLEELAADPQSYFRSVEAYAAFKHAFELHLDRFMDDEQFKALLNSNRVETRACDIETMRTAGVDDTGNIGWIERDCDVGENLLYLKVHGEWVLVAAMGCLNPIDDRIVKPIYVPPYYTPSSVPAPDAPELIVIRPMLNGGGGLTDDFQNEVQPNRDYTVAVEEAAASWRAGNSNPGHGNIDPR
jgi:hypothetical protein